MSNRQRKPRWWGLYLLAALMAGLLFLEVKTRLSQPGHEALEIGIVGVGYGLIWLWLGDNRPALTGDSGRGAAREAEPRARPFLGQPLARKEMNRERSPGLAAQTARRNGPETARVNETSSQ